jgi:predicted Fe-Mo cluster-binding NifX family protein
MKNKTIVAVAASDASGLDSQVSAHFGRCAYYVRAEVTDGIVDGISVRSTASAGAHVPGVMPKFVQEMGADLVVAGGMGPRAIQLFTSMGISVATGARGTVSEVLQEWLDGELSGIVPCAHDHPDSCGGHHA